MMILLQSASCFHGTSSHLVYALWTTARGWVYPHRAQLHKICADFITGVKIQWYKWLPKEQGKLLPLLCGAERDKGAPAEGLGTVNPQVQGSSCWFSKNLLL